MGIQINGNTNNINAGIGSLSIEDLNELDIVGVATAANFKTGVSNLHNVGLTLSGGQIDVGSNIKIGTAGVVTATTFVGNLTGTATQVSLAAQSSDTDCYPVFSLTATGNQALYTKSNRLSFNSATGALSATSFVGALPISNDTNNRVITATGSGGLNGEANLTFDGKTLTTQTTSYPETTELTTEFKAGVANGNRYLNRYIKITNTYTGSAHGAIPIVWEANANGSNDKSYGSIGMFSDGAITFYSRAAGSAVNVGSSLGMSERLRIGNDGKLVTYGTGAVNAEFNTSLAAGAYHKYDLSASGATTGYIGAGQQIVTGAAIADFGIRSQSNMVFSTGGSTERLRIHSGGQVTIGTQTSNTSDRFTIVDPGNAFMSLRSETEADGHSQIIDFAVGAANRSSSNLVSSITASIPTGAAASGTLKGYLSFSTNSGDSLSERLRIHETGQLDNLSTSAINTKFKTSNSTGSYNIYEMGNSGASLAFIGSAAQLATGGGATDFCIRAQSGNLKFCTSGADPRVNIRAAGSNRGSLEVYGNFNESDTTAIEINDNGDARKVYLTNSSGDFNALTRNGSQTKGQLKMFESGVLIHNMKNPDATSTLQTFRTSTYKVTTGSTYTSVSPIQVYMQKGDPNNYGCFEEGNCQLEVNGGGNDHYQPVAFVPRGYNLDTTSFGGQWAGEMWIHQTSSQNPTSYGYSGYNTWATMSFKCRWDCAHWNAKPSGFWVEHYINQGRGNIAKIDASDTMSQFVIYLLPGVYKMRWNCVRGMSVHRAVSDGGSLTLRDGGSFATYNTLAYSSRNTSFDSEISPGSASFAHCT